MVYANRQVEVPARAGDAGCAHVLGPSEHEGAVQWLLGLGVPGLVAWFGALSWRRRRRIQLSGRAALGLVFAALVIVHLALTLCLDSGSRSLLGEDVAEATLRREPLDVVGG